MSDLSAITFKNPSSLGILPDIIGTRADVVKPNEAWPEKEFIHAQVLDVVIRDAGGDQNVDVIMIARIDLTTNDKRVMSIPRDLQVELPGYGQNKINSAYNIGV